MNIPISRWNRLIATTANLFLVLFLILLVNVDILLLGAPFIPVFVKVAMPCLPIVNLMCYLTMPNLLNIEIANGSVIFHTRNGQDRFSFSQIERIKHTLSGSIEVFISDHTRRRYMVISPREYNLLANAWKESSLPEGE